MTACQDGLYERRFWIFIAGLIGITFSGEASWVNLGIVGMVVG
jgi:hypothetical protein